MAPPRVNHPALAVGGFAGGWYAGELRDQDKSFCDAMRAAIASGAESAITSVSTQAGTRRPVVLARNDSAAPSKDWLR